MKSKNIILTEEQMKLIKEYINQLQIPFEEFGDENGKENYDYYLDYIEEVGQYGTLPPSNISKKEMIEDYKERLFHVYHDINEVEEFIMNNPQYYRGDLSDIGQSSEYMLLSKLTREGYYKLVDSCFDVENIVNQFILNENGLIYVERVVSIDFDPKEKPTKHTYHYHRCHYKEFGTHWSYLKGGATDFRYNDDFSEKKNCFIFKGFVNPENVYIDRTIYHNVNYPNEHEITIRDMRPIQINEIIWFETGQKLPLKQPIIIKA